MNNVLITGGTGFVGSWMVRQKPDDCNVWVMNREDYEKVLIETITGLDYVVHLANVSPYPAIECARRNNCRLLYCSSGIVYHPENNTEYRQNKVRWEQECRDSGLDVVIARPFSFCGFNVHKTFFDAARKGETLEVWGDCIRSFMHGSDLGRWMWAILLKGENGHAYDVGSDWPVSIKRFAERIGAFTGCEIKYIDKPVTMPVYLPENARETKSLVVK